MVRGVDSGEGGILGGGMACTITPPQVFTDEKKSALNTLQIDTENEMSTFSSSVKAKLRLSS